MSRFQSGREDLNQVANARAEVEVGDYSKQEDVDDPGLAIGNFEDAENDEISRAGRADPERRVSSEPRA